MKIENIVFLQGDGAIEAIDILNEQGELRALKYLMQWHHPMEHEINEDWSNGIDDRIFELNNYRMSYNLNLGYIGLECKIK